MYGRLLCGLVAILLVLMILTPIAGPAINIVKAEAVGYLAIKDYLGTTWTLEDVEKIINTTIQTATGELKSLADFFWIVIDDDPENNKYNLRDFIRSPLDNTTAVLPLTPGDHYIDIYWFGYHQRQLVNIVENTHYVLNLETAPVIPLPLSSEPPYQDYDWDVIGVNTGPEHEQGIYIKRRDGFAYVHFVFNQSYVTVAVYDDDIGDYNYYTLDIDINTNYKWLFRLTDPNQYYYEEVNTNAPPPPFAWSILAFWMIGWQVPVVKVKEYINVTRPHPHILHVKYIVAFSTNNNLFNAWEEMFTGLENQIRSTLESYVSPVTGTIHRVQAFIQTLNGMYNAYIGAYTPNDIQFILLVWEVYCTPTQIIIYGRAWNDPDLDPDTEGTPIPVTSNNAFIVNNVLVFTKLLHGGAEYYYVNNNEYQYTFSTSASPAQYNIKIKNSYTVQKEDYTFYFPGGDYFVFSVDDLSKYTYEFWLSFREKANKNDNDEYVKMTYSIKLNITFLDSVKADLFEQRLNYAGVDYTRSGNTFTLVGFSSGEYKVGTQYTTKTHILDWDNIYDYIPGNSSGFIKFSITGRIKMRNEYGSGYVVYYIKDIHVWMIVKPKLVPPQISLLKDGYQTVNGAFAVQIVTEKVNVSAIYSLGYYVLGNEPPPLYMVDDLQLFPEEGKVKHVYTLISVDCFGQDIVSMVKTFDETTHVHTWNLSIKPTVRLFNDVTLTYFSWEKMKFLNLDPNIARFVIEIPPTDWKPNYASAIIDYTSLQIINITLGEGELYYFDPWEKVTIQQLANNTFRILVNETILLEEIKVGDVGYYWYKYVVNDTEYKGFLYNNNGTLQLITGTITFMLPHEEYIRILENMDISGLLDELNEAWKDVARKLGLISKGLAAVANWFNANWIWLLLGFFGVMFMILLIFALASRPRITVAVPRTR